MGRYFAREIVYTYVATTRACSSVRFAGPPRGFIARVRAASVIFSRATPVMMSCVISSIEPPAGTGDEQDSEPRDPRT